MTSQHRMGGVGPCWVVAGVVLLAGVRSACGQAVSPLIVTGTADSRVEFVSLTPASTWTASGSNAGFSVGDGLLTAPTFFLDSSAPAFSLRAASTGRIAFSPNVIGFAPQRSLHVFVPDTPALRLEQSTATGNLAQAFDLECNESGFNIVDVTNSDTIPFSILPGAPANSLFVATNGSVGMGTATPDASSRVEIRSSLLNGLLMRRADANPHYLRVENINSVFRCGVQSNGDTQFGALSAGRGLNLIAGGTSKVSINGVGQISFGSPPPAITTHALLHSSGANLTLAGVWTNASSRALKQDIQPITSEQARDTVRALQPVGYRYKSEPDEKYVGFIAEDVPELVATRDRKGLAPMDITAVLTRVVQDQDQQLDQQRQELGKQQQVIAQQQKLLETLSQRLEALELKQPSP